jgi:hypothetical protein
MNQVLRDCYKGIAYCHYHPDDLNSKKVLDKRLMVAWAMGYPKTFFAKISHLTDEIKVTDMTEWEVKHIFDK